MDWEMSWLRRRAAGLAVLLGVAPAGADPPAWSWQVGLGSTLFSRSPDNGFQLARAQGLAGAVDRRFSDLHLFFQGELNGWRDRRDDGSIDLTLALNLGVGLGLDHAGGHLRSTVVGGTSLLLLPDTAPPCSWRPGFERDLADRAGLRRPACPGSLLRRRLLHRQRLFPVLPRAPVPGGDGGGDRGSGPRSGGPAA
jgi:hypothetical protein